MIHEADVSQCSNGWDECDRSRLSENDLAAVELAARNRKMSDCTEGLPSESWLLTGADIDEVVPSGGY